MATERTVYILDDDAAILRSLERLLSSANFEPIAFDHPDHFLTAAKTFKTGCVLLDVRLPGMSGLDVQAQLLKMRNDLAVIVVTGQGDIQIRPNHNQLRLPSNFPRNGLPKRLGSEF
jgi:two-component system, LuxR family, response regulator FixJ